MLHTPKHLIFSALLGLLSLLCITACGDDDHAPMAPMAADRPCVLWLGTSIPEGCTYPQYACEANGWRCINHSLGASFLCLPDLTHPVTTHTGYSLTMTSDEMEAAFRPMVKSGALKKATLKYWKSITYESLLLRDLPRADVVVIDHGFNDKETIAREVLQGYDAIDWNSRDRSTFVGAFNYLYDLIRTVNPRAVVCVGGYFQNSCTAGYAASGRDIATICQWIAQHYDLPLLDAWNYVGLSDGYVPGSAHYLDSLNARYGTEFRPKWTDAEGNITHFQRFCPDAVHPFSDPTGQSDRVLDEVFARVLHDRLLSGPPGTDLQEP